jgi:hypothetical protein
VAAVPLLPGLLPGPSGNFGTAPEERVAELLARPASVHSVHRPVVGLDDGRCLGYEATVRIADTGEQSSAPWFRAAAQTGLSGRLGALALNAALRERATMPGERFLVVTGISTSRLARSGRRASRRWRGAPLEQRPNRIGVARDPLQGRLPRGLLRKDRLSRRHHRRRGQPGARGLEELSSVQRSMHVVSVVHSVVSFLGSHDLITLAV